MVYIAFRYTTMTLAVRNVSERQLTARVG